MNDRPNGEGGEIYPDNSRYEGTFFNGRKHGQGKYTWAEGKIYKGQFVDGHIHGEGKLMAKGQISSFFGTF